MAAVSVQNLFDYLEEGDSLDVLLEQFPSVSRDMAVAVLELARAALLPDAHPCDESLPKDLAPLITEHEVTTVRAAGWSSVKNGRRLTLAAAGFDVFLTADRNLEYQQNLPPSLWRSWSCSSAEPGFNQSSRSSLNCSRC
jgi:hypothetical protein